MRSQWIDVVFKDRNQAYGAYELRRENSRNTNKALLIAASVFVLVLSVPTIVNIISGFIPKADPPYRSIEVNITPPPPIEQQITPPPVQQKIVQSQHDMVRFPPPIVKPDNEARDEPPTDTKLIDTDPGPQTMKGNPGADIVIDEKVGPKVMEGVTEASDEKTIFITTEVNPSFPGGEAAFGKFLQNHIRYPAIAKENGVQGRAFIQFVVERDGSLTDMKILRDPGSGLGEEAVRVLKSSPHWSPGIQNGRPVRVQYTVPVNFSLAAD